MNNFRELATEYNKLVRAYNKKRKELMKLSMSHLLRSGGSGNIKIESSIEGLAYKEGQKEKVEANIKSLDQDRLLLLEKIDSLRPIMDAAEPEFRDQEKKRQEQLAIMVEMQREINKTTNVT